MENVTNKSIIQIFLIIICISYVSELSYSADPVHIAKAKDTLKCQNCDLRDIDFSNMRLQGIDLEQSNLTDAILINADLSVAKKEKFDLPANLQRANLNGADLSGANLTGANLSGAYLINAKLVNTNLTGANLSDAKVEDFQLEKAIFEGQ